MTYESLQLCTGPACPHCGCRDSKILQPAASGEDRDYAVGASADRWPRSPWWGAGRATCNHCGSQFSFQEVGRKEVAASSKAEKPTICPSCGGSRYYVYKNKGSKQYRKCRDCRYSLRNGPEES